MFNNYHPHPSNAVEGGTVVSGTAISVMNPGGVDNLESNGSGALKVSVVGGSTATEYTEGDTDTTITGGVVMWEDAGDTIRAASAAKPLPVEIITGGGAGTQYTEGDTDASITGTAMMMEGAGNALVAAPGTATDGLLVNLGSNNDVTVTGSVTANAGTNLNTSALALETTATSIKTAVETIDNAISGSEMQVDVVTSALPTGASTLAEQQSQTTHLATIAGDTTDIETAVELIDDTVATFGTTTYSEATTKGIMVGGVRRDADTSLVDTTNEIVPFQMDAAGKLKVEAFSGETLPVSLTSTTITGTVAVTQSGTWDEVGINDSGNSITVDNGGTFVVQENGAALTALQLIDDGVYTDDTSTHSTGSSKGYGIMAAATPTDASVDANDIGMVGMTTDRKLHVAVMDALPAGTNAIGKLSSNSGVDIGDVTLTANSGVDIGDVDVTSIIPGTGATNLGKAEDGSHTSGDVGVMALGVRQDSPNATFNASNDYQFMSTDMVGGVRTALYETDFAVLGTKHVKKYYTNAGAVTDGIIWSPAAGARWYVTDIFINVSAAATVTLEDDLVAGDSAVWKAELAANSGWSHSFQTPLFSGEDAADLLITTSAGNVYVTVTGYEI